MASPVRCPKCRAYIPAGATFCGLCGTRLSPQPADQPGTGHPNEPPPGQEDKPPTSTAPKAAPTFAPKNLGDLLRETFRVYGKNLWTMWWISLIANIPTFLFPLLLEVFPQDQAIALSIYPVGSLFTGLLGCAASVHAVAQWYLGRRASALSCYVAALENGNSLLLAALVFVGAVVASAALIVILVGIPLLAFVSVVFFFFIQAIMVERKRPMESLRRSLALVQGSWWRVFGIGAVFLAILLTGAIGAALPGMVLVSTSQLAGNLLSALGGVFVLPVWFIGGTLVYFDLRVRKEDFTLGTLASDVAGPKEKPSV